MFVRNTAIHRLATDPSTMRNSNHKYQACIWFSQSIKRTPASFQNETLDGFAKFFTNFSPFKGFCACIFRRSWVQYSVGQLSKEAPYL
jgi:hypothetical protein